RNTAFNWYSQDAWARAEGLMNERKRNAQSSEWKIQLDVRPFIGLEPPRNLPENTPRDFSPRPHCAKLRVLVAGQILPDDRDFQIAPQPPGEPRVKGHVARH